MSQDITSKVSKMYVADLNTLAGTLVLDGVHFRYKNDADLTLQVRKRINEYLRTSGAGKDHVTTLFELRQQIPAILTTRPNAERLQKILLQLS